MKISIVKFHRKRALIKIGATFSFLCVIYYSYLPFLFIVNVLPIEKNSIFILFSIAALGLCLLCYYPSIKRLNKNLLILIGLYILFSLYSIVNFLLTPSQLNNVVTLRTLFVINPMFITLAFLCLHEKEYVLKLFYLAAFSYFIIAVYSFLSGRLLLSSGMGQDIFGVTAIAPYQSINMYLGVFVILTAVKYIYCKNLFFKTCIFSAIIAAIGIMLLIGGRAPLVAAIFCVVILYFLETLSGKVSVSITTFLLICTIFLFVFIASDTIVKVLIETLTFKKIVMLFEGGDQSLRLFLFSNAIELFLLDSKNVILGAGMNYFPTYIGEKSLGWYPHNIILELLAEYGILGALLFFFPILYIVLLRISRSGTVYGRSYAEKSIFLLAIYFWLIYMVTGGLRNSWVLIFFTYLLMPNNPKVQFLHYRKMKIDQDIESCTSKTRQSLHAIIGKN